MKLIATLQAHNQDFEFYPTTDEIIRALIKDLKRPLTKKEESAYGRGETFYNHDKGRYERSYSAILDIGAGHGKVLRALKQAVTCSSLFAIEKSDLLCQHLIANEPDIFIIGTDFHEQSLITKKADLIFCNPPYSQFEDWTVKILREAPARWVYLVIPQRWEQSVPVRDALRHRDAEAHIVGSFDFADAEDRKARAVVHLLRITIPVSNDAFATLFAEQFADLVEKFKHPLNMDKKDASDAMKGQAERERQSRFRGLTVGASYPERMVALYDEEMARIQENYRAVGTLDAGLLAELDISPSRIMVFLRERLSGLKNAYWKELFDRLDTITSRLTTKSREQLLEVLRSHTAIDFTSSNIFTTILWAIHNANRRMGEQLLEVYTLMVEKANVQLYKSNQRTFRDEDWRYRQDPGPKNSHYALDYRIVTYQVGGIQTYYHSRGLEDRAFVFLRDLLTIANNLGFHTPMNPRPLWYNDRDQWKSGVKHEFFTTDRLGFEETLFDVRAFKNGNLHLRFNKRFMLALNVEFGRLKGWINTPAEAADELRDPDAAQFFNTLHQLPTSPQLLLAA